MSGLSVNGDYVKRACLLRGWTQADLAREARIGHGTAKRAWDGGCMYIRTQIQIMQAFADTRDQIRQSTVEFLAGQIA